MYRLLLVKSLILFLFTIFNTISRTSELVSGMVLKTSA